MLISKKIYIPDGKKKEVTELKLNVDFWKQAIKKYGSISVVIDEAHTVLNPRRAMSKKNILMTDFIALIRRILGSASDGYGELILITQLERRLDPIAKEMATSVHYHICHYTKRCVKCGLTWKENNECPESIWACPKCESTDINKFDHVIEVWHFANMRKYLEWKDFGAKAYHRHYFITDIEDYFCNFFTLQWDNLISDY